MLSKTVVLSELKSCVYYMGSLSALHVAARNGHAECITLLLRTGIVDINLMSKGARRTALHYAAEAGHERAVSKLLQHEFAADTSLPDAFGNSPLHLAAARGHTQVCEVLLQNDVGMKNLPNNHGLLPLDVAKTAECRQVCAGELLPAGFIDEMEQGGQATSSPLWRGEDHVGGRTDIYRVGRVVAGETHHTRSSLFGTTMDYRSAGGGREPFDFASGALEGGGAPSSTRAGGTFEGLTRASSPGRSLGTSSSSRRSPALPPPFASSVSARVVPPFGGSSDGDHGTILRGSPVVDEQDPPPIVPLPMRNFAPFVEAAQHGRFEASAIEITDREGGTVFGQGSLTEGGGPPHGGSSSSWSSSSYYSNGVYDGAGGGGGAPRSGLSLFDGDDAWLLDGGGGGSDRRRVAGLSSLIYQAGGLFTKRVLPLGPGVGGPLPTIDEETSEQWSGSRNRGVGASPGPGVGSGTAGELQLQRAYTVDGSSSANHGSGMNNGDGPPGTDGLSASSPAWPGAGRATSSSGFSTEPKMVDNVVGSMRPPGDTTSGLFRPLSSSDHHVDPSSSKTPQARLDDRPLRTDPGEDAEELVLEDLEHRVSTAHLQSALLEQKSDATSANPRSPGEQDEESTECGEEHFRWRDGSSTTATVSPTEDSSSARASPSTQEAPTSKAGRSTAREKNRQHDHTRTKLETPAPSVDHDVSPGGGGGGGGPTTTQTPTFALHANSPDHQKNPRHDHVGGSFGGRGNLDEQGQEEPSSSSATSAHTRSSRTASML